MKIIVFSDSHRYVEPMELAVRLEKPDAAMHLGDHDSDAEELSRLFPGLVMYSVCGNCDIMSDAPRRIVTDIGGVRLFLTHGHDYGVKYGLEKAINTAMSAGADVLMFGHTHQETYLTCDGLQIINPGCVRDGRHPYGILTVVDNKAVYEQKYLS